MQDFVILVDEQDNPIGTAEKMEAHQHGGKLHRAFSVLVFNDKGETMLQRRAASKYHCPGLWTNTCCSHPRPDETSLVAATRRLQEEMGFICPLEEKFSFLYRAEFSNGLTEHEFDHVFIGRYNDSPSINPMEADDWRWISMSDLEKEMADDPDRFTPWFTIIVQQYREKLG